jgi:hypothetical protein
MNEQQVNRLGFGNAKSSPECQWVDSKQIPIRPMADCCLQTRQHAWAPSPRGFQCPEPLLEEAFVGRIPIEFAMFFRGGVSPNPFESPRQPIARALI